jgi:hypothetical protein
MKPVEEWDWDDITLHPGYEIKDAIEKVRLRADNFTHEDAHYWNSALDALARELKLEK